MTDAAIRAGRVSDNAAYVALLAVAWAGVLAGFGPGAFETLLGERPSREPIMHVHAVVFMGWMAILTAQLLLAGRGRIDLHKRLGVLAAGWAVLLVGVGTATLVFDLRTDFDRNGASAVGLATGSGSMLGFTVLVGLALAFRGRSDWHKRLMMLGTVALLAAGFGRALRPWLDPLLPDTAFADWLQRYAGPNAIILSLLAWDLISRGRLHAATVAGAVVLWALQATATALRFHPDWPAVANALIGR